MWICMSHQVTHEWVFFSEHSVYTVTERAGWWFQALPMASAAAPSMDRKR